MGGAKQRAIREENLVQAAEDLKLGDMFTFQQDTHPLIISQLKSGPRANWEYVLQD